MAARRRRWSLLAVPLFVLVTIQPGAAAAATDAGQAPDAAEDIDPAEAEAAKQQAEIDAAREALRTAQRTAAERRRAAAQAQAAARAVDGGVRAAEEGIIPAVIERWEAEDALEAAHEHVATTERRLRDVEAAVAVVVGLRSSLRGELGYARDELEDRVVRAYKHGSVAAETSWILGAAQQAVSPGDLVTATKHLDTAVSSSFGDVLALYDDLAALQQDLARLRGHLDEVIADLEVAHAAVASAEVALAAAEVAVDGAEDTAAARRGAADAAEARVLAAAARALDAEAQAERTLERARERLADALDDAGAALATASDAPSTADDEDASIEERREWLGARQRSLERGRALPPSARRADDGWICPVEGGQFINDWGFPRSQNRRHQGTDVFAARGTPIVSPVEGRVSALDPTDRFDGRRDLGGITVSIERDNERFYHAHLEGIHPDLARGAAVDAGQVIGWVGRTGNARGTAPHLHFGWYVDGVAVNPYVSLALACHAGGRDER